MKKKCIIAAFLFIIVYCMTACGFCYSVDSVVAREQEVVIIKDELVVPLASKTKEEAVDYMVKETKLSKKECSDAYDFYKKLGKKVSED